MRRLTVVIGLLSAGSLALTGCTGDDGGGGDEAEVRAEVEPVVVALAEALAAGAEVAGGDDPVGDRALARLAFVDEEGQAVAEEYDEIVVGLNGIVPEISVGEIVTDEASATVTLAWSWPVVDGEDAWTYETSVDLEEVGGEWALVWERSVVEPSLEAKEVLESTTLPSDRGDITGAGGEVIVTERPVLRLGINRVQVATDAEAVPAARYLAEAVGIDVAPYVDAVKAAGDRSFVEAIIYRKGEVPAGLLEEASDVEGVHIVRDDIALAPTREFAAPILGRVGAVTEEIMEDNPGVYDIGDIAGVSGLQARYDEQLRGAPGRMVEARDPSSTKKARTLWQVDAVDGDKLALTLDVGLQETAESLLADVRPASALVAVRPSDGAILAAANGPGTEGLNLATYGQFPPGSTFKIVTSLALLRSGLTPDSTVDCSPTVTVDGKQFKNYDDYPSSGLGDIPLRTALANSCNTAMISSGAELKDGDLADAAASLGLGVDHDLGFPAYFGSVEPPASETEAAADLIGQGTVLASPMAMATVIASVQEGALVVPQLVKQVDVGPHDHEELTATEAKQLRMMLREVVTSGSGAGLADVPGDPVIAKTGTAEFGDGSQTHAWMVAAHGDLAVAVFVEVGESGSQTAGPILEAFLRAAGS